MILKKKKKEIIAYEINNDIYILRDNIQSYTKVKIKITKNKISHKNEGNGGFIVIEAQSTNSLDSNVP